MGLTQGFFKVLPAMLELEMCEILCEPFKNRDSVSYSSPALLYTSRAGVQNQIFWGLIFPVLDPQAGDPDVGLGPLASWGEPLPL